MNKRKEEKKNEKQKQMKRKKKPKKKQRRQKEEAKQRTKEEAEEAQDEAKKEATKKAKEEVEEDEEAKEEAEAEEEHIRPFSLHIPTHMTGMPGNQAAFRRGGASNSVGASEAASWPRRTPVPAPPASLPRPSSVRPRFPPVPAFHARQRNARRVLCADGDCDRQGPSHVRQGCW